MFGSFGLFFGFQENIFTFFDSNSQFTICIDKCQYKNAKKIPRFFLRKNRGMLSIVIRLSLEMTLSVQEVAHAVAEDVEGVRIRKDLRAETSAGGRHADKLFRLLDDVARFESAVVFLCAEEEFDLLEIFVVFDTVTGGFETDGGDGSAVGHGDSRIHKIAVAIGIACP